MCGGCEGYWVTSIIYSFDKIQNRTDVLGFWVYNAGIVKNLLANWFGRVWRSSKILALVLFGLTPVVLCLLLASSILGGGNRSAATPTAAAGRVTTQVIGTQAPAVAATVVASGTPAPTLTAMPTATVIPTSTSVPTAAATSTPKPSETPKPTEAATNAPKVANTATPLSKAASVAVVATETRVVAPTATAAPVIASTATAVSAQVRGQVGSTPGTSGRADATCSQFRASASAAPESPVRIVAINKVSEVVTIRNMTNANVSVAGWRICSIKGDQLHATLSGVIGGGEQVTIGSAANGAIWNNGERDDGALYDASGRRVSYWADSAR